MTVGIRVTGHPRELKINPDEELIFHGRGYPAGTTVQSDIGLNWYEIGYQYHIRFGKQQMNFLVAPTVAFALLDFSAELESNSERNSRSYTKGTPRLGLVLEWFPSKRISTSGKGIGSLPFNNMPQIDTVGLAGKYNLMNIDRFKVSLSQGIEYDWIDFEDSQREPNRVKANMGPLGLIGAEIKF
jgi:hypothetical protein